MFETTILITFFSTWILAWVIFRRKYRWNLEIEQSPNLNGKIFIFCDPVPNEGVRIRIIDKDFIQNSKALALGVHQILRRIERLSLL